MSTIRTVRDRVYTYTEDGSVAREVETITHTEPGTKIGDAYVAIAADAPTDAAPTCGPRGCTAAINTVGAHYWCDLMAGHTGWPHSNEQIQTVWRGDGDDPTAATLPGEEVTADIVDEDKTPAPGYHVELGGYRFTQGQWEAIEAYCDLRARTQA